MLFNSLNLDERILNSIQKLGYKTPTSVQALVIPEVLAKHDVVTAAQTGTGKTAAFVLPILQQMIDRKKMNAQPHCLILTPTRELAMQVTKAVNQYGALLRPKVVNLVGGMPYAKQIKALSGPLDIIVATPGRLLDHLDNKRVKLSNIETLVIDEADRMLDMNFTDDVKAIANATKQQRQTLLFSATIDNHLNHMIKFLMNNPKWIRVADQRMTPQKIKQKLYYADNSKHKKKLLQHFLHHENVYKAIIFSATKINASRLATELCHMGFEAGVLHGDLKQNKRTRTIEELRKGKIQFLVATDVAARGIDIADVSHVFNYDLPRFHEDYVHRIGRTGRAGKSGIAISFALPADIRLLQRIERYTSHKLHRETIHGLEPTGS